MASGDHASLTARTARSRRTGPVAWVLIWPIRGYQLGISRFTPPTCRYYPCCSSYAIDALRVHGALKGLVLAAWRLLRCHPWSAGGVDLVPIRGHWRGRDGSLDEDCSIDEDSANENDVIPACRDLYPRTATESPADDAETDARARLAGRTAA